MDNKVKIVRKIIEEVKKDGDKAVKKYTVLFDNSEPKKISRKDIQRAYQGVDKETVQAMKKAIANIERFAKAQLKQLKDFEYTKDGVTLGQKVIPIEKIGVYVPGGRYPLPSTALMCLIPARVAGVKEIVVCSPKIKPITVVAADLAGADSIFSIGGAQAIAAMAYGTETIPKVDKIVGPGNVYVTLAKKEVFGDCGIDLLAGPSEILIIADKDANPGFIAADLLAQAEHDIEAKIFFLTDSKPLIRKVEAELRKQIKEIKTKGIIRKSLRNKKMVLVKSIKEAIKIANEIAPEHLELQVNNPKKYLKEVKNYGSLFLGEYSGVVFGDYCSGTNHVLPTDKAARYTGGLSVKDFVKVQTYQQVSKDGAKNLAKTAKKLASAEGLEAHKKSVEIKEDLK